MKKRRRLADKFVICICAVLCAVSAFFYAPMEVEAGVSSTVSSFSSDLYKRFDLTDSNKIYLKDYLDSDVGYYRVSMDITANFNSNVDVWLNNFFVCFNSCGLFQQMSDQSSAWETSHSFTEHRDFYLDAAASRDSTVFTVYYKFITALRSSPSSLTVNCSYSVSNVLVQEISSIDYDSYTQGYNAGYAEGESAGYGNGYSNGFADGESSVDTGAIYDEAFQAGKDSVDTQSYYDAGYQAGYDAAYSAGYESGYDVGYQSAMDRIESWGADTTDYPILVNSGNFESGSCHVSVTSESQGLIYDDHLVRFSNNINPFHVYKVCVDVKNVRFGENYYNSSQDYVADSYPYLSCVIGNNNYLIDDSDSWVAEFFVPGDQMSNIFSLRCNFNGASVWHDADNGDWPLGDVWCRWDSFNLELYDYGPSGDTQNHIANQTDQLTNGFDETQGNSVNSDLSSGLNEYQTAEDSLWATATTGLKDFTFFDFESVPAMITGITFITSIMGSWFEQTGGTSGVGIVLSILFSVMLVAMVLGLYRWYQSRGGKK